jgi:hypothetical protein
MGIGARACPPHNLQTNGVNNGQGIVNRVNCQARNYRDARF